MNAFVVPFSAVSRSSFVAAPNAATSPLSPPVRARPRLSRRASITCAVDFDALGQQWTTATGAERKTPTQVIDHALTNFPGEVAIAFSGAEDVVLIEFASRTKKPYRVFALDTGRLHPQTYRFYSEVERHYGIKIEYTFPDTQEVVEFVNEKGLFSFYEDGHQECCRVRKVRPLRRKLSTLSAWITGQRKDQSPGTRADIPIVQTDPAFKGKNDSVLIKYNPLANVSSSEVWATIRATEVPYNALHLEGYTSIGCEPCTRPVLPNQHEREGRWWWEEATKKECGLHAGNVSTDAAAAGLADDFVSDSIKKDKVVLFTKKGCPYCAALMDLFAELGVPYKEYTISEMNSYGDLVASLERSTGQKTAPNLFIAANHIGGNEEAQTLHAAGKLLPLLEKSGVQIRVSA